MNYGLIALKRHWYPEWLWRYTHRLALIYPFRWIMTYVPKMNEHVKGCAARKEPCWPCSCPPGIWRHMQ